MTCADDDKRLNVLAAPVRNHYFYGMMLDERRLTLEQRYFMRKRWMLNRLGLGKGVLEGLSVSVGEGGLVCIEHGVAIDGYGREIIVPQRICIDPRKLTDDCGEPAGTFDDDAQVCICLAYQECYADYSPVLVSDCNTPEQCAPAAIMEGYRLLVRKQDDAAPPCPPTTDEPWVNLCRALRQDASSTRRHKVCEVLPEILENRRDADACVPLAVVRVRADGRLATEDIQVCEYRPMLYSNAVLYEMILCLAGRLEECCDGTPPSVMRLEYVAGDNQTAQTANPVANPLQVRVLRDGTPLPNETVIFDIVEGGGQIGTAGTLLSSYPTLTANDGIATLPVWKLGPMPGPNRVLAHISTGTPSEYMFRANGNSISQELLVVDAVEILNRSGGTSHKFASPTEWPGLPQAQGIAQIRVTFNKDLDEISLSTQPSGLGLPNPDPSVSFLVATRSPLKAYSGSVRRDSSNKRVAIFELEGDNILQQGEHEVVLYGSQDTLTRMTIQAQDGSPLDGEPVAMWTSGPFSGEGTPGGDFRFHFTITQ